MADEQPHPARPAEADRPRPRKSSKDPADRSSSRLLPDETSDERDLVTPTADDWYERERPPHHG